MPCRKLKRESSIPTSPSVPDADLKMEAPNSPKRGRKESEQKRRVLMNQYFDELIVLLMLLRQKHVPQKMDKVATLKETITSLKVYYQLTHLDAPLSPLPKDKVSKYVIGRGDALSLILNSQDSFLVLVSESGRIMFSNPLVTSLLGYTQTRLIGQNWYDFVHDKDKELFQSLFKSSNGRSLSNSSMTVFPTRACTLHIQLYSGETGGQPQYLPFKCLAHHRECTISESATEEPLSPGNEIGGSVAPLLDKQEHFVVLIGKLPTSLLHVDLPVGTNDVNFDFELRVSKEGRLICIEEHAILIIGYNTSEIIGTSFFDYVDPYHLSDIAESISSLNKTGVGVTSPYRFMTKSGRYIWLISKTYTSYDPWINKPDHILFTNRVLGSDQVLPEHRFYRSRKLLPDLECEQEYVIPSCTHTPSLPANPTAFGLQQNPLVERYLTDPVGSLMGQGGIVDPQLNIPSLSEEHRRMPAPLLQLGQQQQGPSPLPQEQSTLWKGIQQQYVEPAPPPGPFTTTSTRALPPQGLVEIQLELERKNREIFEMQQKMLEQQKLFEAERNQFYQVSQHVLNYITASVTGNQPNTSSESKFLTTTADTGTKKFGSVYQNVPLSTINPTHSLNAPPQHRMYPQNSSNPVQYGSRSTPVTDFSPFPPPSQMYTSPSPTPAIANSLDYSSSQSRMFPPTSQMYTSPFPTPAIANSLDYASSQSRTSSHLGLYDSNRSMFYPPQQPESNAAYTTHTPSQEAAPFTDSLSIHNSMVCDTFGLSNEQQLPQSSPSPIVSQIQALSNMFEGR